MMAGLMGSIRSIFWGTVLLSFVLLVWAIVAVQFIHPLQKDLGDRGFLEGCDRCPRAYSSVLQSTLTFSQQIVAGDSWGQATIPLIEHYPVTAIYFMGVFLSVGFAVMNLILGVVVNVAQTEHDRLKGEIDEQKNIQRMEASNNLRSICQQMDADGSGELSKEELLGGYKDREDFREAIAELDLTEEDMTIAFAGMDVDKSGTVSYDEFLKKIYKLKESDTTFMMEQVKFNIINVRDVIMNTLLKQQAQLLALEHAEMETLNKIEIEETVVMEQLGVDTTSPTTKGMQQKEQKLSLQEEENKPGKPSGGPDEVKMRDGPEGELLVATVKEIRDTVLSVSQHLQGELRDTLKKLDQNAEMSASNTTSIISQLPSQRPVEELPRNISNAFIPPPMCCRV